MMTTLVLLGKKRVTTNIRPRREKSLLSRVPSGSYSIESDVPSGSFRSLSESPEPSPGPNESSGGSGAPRIAVADDETDRG